MPRKPADDDLPPKQQRKRGKNAYSSFTISRDIRESMHAALYYDGGPTRFFVWLKKHKPEVFAGCVMKALVKDDESALGGLNIIVQKIVIGADAQPIAGVLCSPVEQHVPRLVANAGQLVEPIDGQPGTGD